MPQHDPHSPVTPDSGRPLRRRPRGGRRPFACLLAAFLLPVFLASCGESKPPAGAATVAVVNGEAIPATELRERLASESVRWGGPPAAMGNREAVKEEILEELIQDRLMLQRARRLALSVTEEELDGEADSLGGKERPEERLPPSWRESLRRRLLIRKVIQRDLYDPVRIAPGEAEAYYREKRASYRREERVRALQIVLRDPHRIPIVRNRLKKGEDFAKVAREESVGPEAKRGGDLGFFSRGTLPDPIDRVVFAMKPGAVSSPIRTPYGYHILKVLQREEGRPPDDRAVREQVIEDLKKARAEAAYGPWMEALRASATIEIRKDALRKVRVPEIGPAAPKREQAPLRDPNQKRR